MKYFVWILNDKLLCIDHLCWVYEKMKFLELVQQLGNPLAVGVLGSVSDPRRGWVSSGRVSEGRAMLVPGVLVLAAGSMVNGQTVVVVTNIV